MMKIFNLGVRKINVEKKLDFIQQNLENLNFEILKMGIQHFGNMTFSQKTTNKGFQKQNFVNFAPKSKH